LKQTYEQYLVSPVTHRPLRFANASSMVHEEESFDVIGTVPIILPKYVAAEWNRELIELILWDYPDQIENVMRDILQHPNEPPAQVYITWIKKLIGGKQDIIRSLERYEAQNTEQWLITSPIVNDETLRSFWQLCSPEIGKKRVETKQLCKGQVLPYYPFSVRSTETHPKTILELATGAGGGTAAIALRKDVDTTLFTIDIDFACLGNAIGIGSYLHQPIFPVCANFWNLPFTNGTMDIVSTFCGLDESRENQKTIAEVARVLKKGGQFVCVSRENAFLRQGAVLEPFGFTKEEITAWLKRCRMYSDAETLKELCNANSLFCTDEVRTATPNGTAFVLTQYRKQ